MKNYIQECEEKVFNPEFLSGAKVTWKDSGNVYTVKKGDAKIEYRKEISGFKVEIWVVYNGYVFLQIEAEKSIVKTFFSALEEKAYRDSNVDKEGAINEGKVFFGIGSLRGEK